MSYYLDFHLCDDFENISIGNIHQLKKSVVQDIRKVTHYFNVEFADLL